MTRSEFTSLLKNPNELNTMSYEALDQLLLQFPYCNGIRMLLLKKYKTDKHIAFERHLALASMYAADRSKLYDFLNTPTVANEKTKVIDMKPSDDSEAEKKTPLTTELADPPPIYQHKVSENPPFLAFQTPLTAEDLSVGYTVSDENEEEENRSLSNMPIEEWLQEFEPPRIDDKNPALKKGFKLSRIPVFEKGVFDFLEEEAEPKENSTQPTTRKAKTSKKKTRKKTKDVSFVPNAKEETLEDTFPKVEVDKSEQELEFQNLEQMYEKNAESVDIFDLFLTQTDGFLKSIGDKKESDIENSTEAWEDDSTTENEEVASETLADLLALQGQKSKAIKMYKTLSLKFPEKSRLFADKIAELA
ncbi:MULTISPECIES: hypothetical protein [unclassified Aureispira]|uniref:hypothetical protein n=1 Tax=unclassified Aureispira TaxID=2649989 RepID=UPI0012DE7037|nr:MULTISPECIES: hypothetical protein [unclassified Aureispira]WMX17392.1 hypothetical protein QP953_13505 [Aureispira sp. CCB-E]